MIPNIPILLEEITEVNYPNRTYRIVCKEKIFTNGISTLNMTSNVEVVDNVEWDRISGYVDELEAVMQAVYLILSTERYEFIIYSWDYGIELVDLFGKPMPYVMAELERRIKDALTQDNRINDVTDFEFTTSGKRLHTTFTVVTNAGNISTALEVDV